MSKASWFRVSVILSLLVLAVGTWFGTKDHTARLSAELVVTNADIGIPGVSKMYEARLVNRGWWPVGISYCDFVDDASAPGRMVAYAVQRWDDQAQRWRTVVESTASDFCKPYPLGIVTARLTSGFLWPGQSIGSGEEATAAREAFNVGDKGRFVVFAGKAGNYSTSFPTTVFNIDEHPQTDISLRSRH